MTRTVKISALILSILVVIAGLPMTVFGAEFNEWLESNASEEYSEAADVSLQKGVYELNELREENVKHFRQEDGSNVAVVYSDAVHYMDADGEWQDIDNTLSDDGNEYGTGNARIKFTKKTPGNGSIFTLHENNRKITLSLDGAIKKTQGSVRASESVLSEDATQLQKLMELSKLSSTISYADIFEGVDLEYDVVSMNIKERIVVKEKLSSYDYSFTLALNNLSARLAEDGSVELYDTSTNDTAYVIPAPFMYDSAEEYSDAVYYTLTDLGNGKYKLLISADDEWINAENRTFPVTIDPAVYPATASGVTDTYINSYSKTLAPYNYQYLYVGNTTQFYWKTANMPTIPDSAYVTKATFTAKYIGGTAETSTYYFGAYQVTSAWDNTLTWNKYKASPASGAYVYANIVDYTTATLTAGTPSQYFYTWDVTEIVRNWEKGDTDYGICISDIPGYTTKNTKFASSEYTTVAHRPKLLIEYRDMKGVEDYWSYTAQNIGNAGTGYVNNATGNLTLAISTLATTDALFGYAPTLVYNSSIAHKEYTSANANVPYTQAHAGFGFKLSTQESIVQRNYSYENDTTRTYYIWADSDGTEHAFYPDDNNAELFYDEDGLGLKLTVDSTANTVTITDRSYNQKIFTAYNGGWVMSSIRDTSGNELIFTLDANARVTKISVKPNGLSAIDFLTLTYNSSGVISRIENTSAKRAVIFNYSSNYLTQAEYAHITTSGDVVDYSASYEYDSAGNIVKARDNTSLYEVNYIYTDNRITFVTEKGGDTASLTTGSTIGFTYDGQTTIIQSEGADDIYDTPDDLATRYVFDTSGRMICYYTTDIDGTTIHGASFGEYVTDNDLAENHISNALAISDSTANYITNGGFEITDNGVPSYWNILQAESGMVGIRTNNERFGSNEVSISAYAEEPVKIYQNVTLPAGEYTLSADFIATNPEVSSIYFVVTDSSGNIQSERVSSDHTTASEGKLFSSMTFTVSNVTNGGDTVEVAIKVSPTATGTSVYVDNVTLNKGIGVSAFSYVNYGSFEQSLSGYAPSTFWRMHDNSALTLVEEDALFGKSLKISGSLNTYKYATQSIVVNSPSGSVQPTFLRLSGFGKAVSQLQNERSSFSIKLEVEYTDSTKSTEEFKFDKFSNEWQFISGLITLRQDKVVSKINIYCNYGYNYGTAYFDEIKVTPITDYSASETLYNERGLVESHRTGAGGEFYLYYEDTQLLDLPYIKVTSGTNKVTIYHYDGNTKNLTQEEVATYQSYIPTTVDLTYISESVYESIPFDYMEEIYMNGMFEWYGTTSYTYNSYGLLTKTSASVAESSNRSFSTVEYNLSSNSKIFGTVSSSTDENGYVTKHFYDENTGDVVASLNGKSGSSSNYTGYAYTHDAAGRLTSVLPATCTATSTSATAVTGSSNVTYTFNLQSRLESLQASGTTYNFTYDIFGNTDTVSVGNQQFVDYNYNVNNGKLASEEYGNGFSARYVYDALDRVSEIWYNNGTGEVKAYTYTYDTFGNVAKLEDHVNEKATVLKYDSNGRIVYSCVFDISDSGTASYANEYSTHLGYDDKSRVTYAMFSIDYAIASAAYKNIKMVYEYTYDVENRLSESKADFSIGVSYITSYNYDAFNRVSSSTMSFKSGDTTYITASTQYTYSVSDNNTGAQISEYVTSVGNSGNGYRYGYDSRGNIVSISNYADDSTVCTYEYDSQNRLTRENNYTLGYSIKYEYDISGNITAKKYYNYTVGTLGTPLGTATYTYNDANWGDKLTAYNGTAITYDGIGNPLSYYNGSSYTFTWKHGKQLASAVTESDTITYTYNADGIRTSKRVNNITYKYTLNGDRVLFQHWWESGIQHNITYVYDENGVIGMLYNNTDMTNDAPGGSIPYDCFIFEKNMQGDVTGIYYSDGTLLARYTYDAWGYPSVEFFNDGDQSAAVLNSMLYRGYFFDWETGLYYLNARYYDPATGRFINSDVVDVLAVDQGNVMQFNLFAYCLNNPVNNTDSSGNWSLPNWAKIAITATIIVAAVVVISTVTAGTGGAAACIALGADKGAISGAVSGAVGGAISGAVGGAVSHRIETGTWEGAGQAALNGAVQGAIDGAMSGAISGAITGAFTSPYCFVAGTAILTGAGYVAIENIKVGDIVWSTNPDTGETALKEVLQTYVNETNELIHVTVDGEEIVTTPSHPFYIPRQGWTDAIHLKAGDILLTVNGEYVVVEKVQHELLEAPVTVYNFEVEDFHTYYVGDGVLVHNDCPNTPGNMNKQVQRNQAPKGVSSVHNAHSQPHGKPHVHFTDGTALNYDGTIHDKKNGVPKLTKAIKDWLIKNGWKGEVNP